MKKKFLQCVFAAAFCLSGDDGEQIIATGTPEEVMENPHSYTGYYLKKVLVGNWSKQ